MIIAPDVSYYQVKVDSSYDREWFIFRGCDGGFLDPNASFNADWSRGAVAEGLISGWTMYVVYRPGMNAAIMSNLAKLGPADRLEIDIESWPINGRPTITGDHSADINSLALDLAAVVGQTNVWRYGNAGDLDSIHPHPVAGQLERTAGYTPTRPVRVNQIGWQYTNGVENHTSNPSTSAPFGACDHNELYVDELSPDGGGIPITKADIMDFIGIDTSSGAGYLFTGGVKVPQTGASFNQLIAAGVQRIDIDPADVDLYPTSGALETQILAAVQALTAAVKAIPAATSGPTTFNFQGTGTATPEATA